MKKSLKIGIYIIVFAMFITFTNTSYADTVRLSFSPYAPQCVRTDGEYIMLEGIDGIEKFQDWGLTIKDEYDEKVYIKFDGEKQDGKVIFKPDRLNPGIYYLNFMFKKNEEKWTYIYYKLLRFYWDGNDWEFQEPLPLAGNLEYEKNVDVEKEYLKYFLQDSREYQSKNPKIIELAGKITQGIEDDYEKIRLIHEWVADHIYYDRDAYNKLVPGQDVSALNTLNTKRSVCAGYANLTVALLQASGIPARKIGGRAFEVGTEDIWKSTSPNTVEKDNPHAWVEAWHDGRWIVLDSTWDSLNKWEKGKITYSDKRDIYNYFDISKELLSATHIVDKANSLKKAYLYMNYNKFKLGDKWVDFDENNLIKPVVIKGKTYVPIAKFIRSIGGSCDYIAPENYKIYNFKPYIDIELGKHRMRLFPNSSKAFLGIQEVRLSAPVKVINGRTMIPIRDVFENIGCMVIWEDFADNWKGRITVVYHN